MLSQLRYAVKASPLTRTPLTPAIAVNRLTKRYRERVALSELSFTVAPGEIVGLLGPNGAGKSTTLGILATLLSFDEGTVSIGGHICPARRPPRAALLGHVPQQVALYPALTATENLHFFARAQGVAETGYARGGWPCARADRPRRSRPRARVAALDRHAPTVESRSRHPHWPRGRAAG